ncbi:exonuclease domain-containing protein [Schlegelella sp. S2-27]|uniref:Excinuclease cho n=1 Tax=Caldimonas mangrovi TaxID=2944811 RepID=A0ABT0YK66_9BURK|nr:3'-5' exonuclease family protein [Caldimonas mangrovi]MCM5678794.1 exonuclease domain-containing protein [Caldimonas mangrovi]
MSFSSALLQRCLSFHRRLAFVDLETTGGTPNGDRITEVAVIQVDEGGVTEWSSLVNPGMSIPPFVQGLTGITNEMVAGAPRFDQLADEIEARLRDRVFVAHNARFDHGFLKQEFLRLGRAFRPAVVCTVKLSRRLFPQHARHNLDALVARHGLQVSDRHRALGDARAIWQFWQAACGEHDADAVRAALSHLADRPTLPSHLDASLLDELPASHGVYFFYGENDLPLYVGKAKDLRKRVWSHFRADHGSAKGMRLSQQVRRIDWQPAAGELGALLAEAAMIKSLAPVHNKLLRRNEEVCAWWLDPAGRAQLVEATELFQHAGDGYYGAFTSERKARTALQEMADAHGLCPATLGLEKLPPGRPCFARQIRRCQGACTGEEDAAVHRQRTARALAPLALQPWPFDGPVGLREGRQMHLLNRWCYLGTATREEEIWPLLEMRAGFDRDVYLLLQKRLPRWPRSALQVFDPGAQLFAA